MEGILCAKHSFMYVRPFNKLSSQGPQEVGIIMEPILAEEGSKVQSLKNLTKVTVSKW